MISNKLTSQLLLKAFNALNIVRPLHSNECLVASSITSTEPEPSPGSEHCVGKASKHTCNYGAVHPVIDNINCQDRKWMRGGVRLLNRQTPPSDKVAKIIMKKELLLSWLLFWSGRWISLVVWLFSWNGWAECWLKEGKLHQQWSEI